MNVPDRTTQRVREWLRQSTPDAPEAERSVDEVMTTLFQASQLRPRSSFRFLRRADWGEGGYSMFSALKIGVATALVALLGGVLAISTLPQEQLPQAPAAATEVATPEISLEDLPPYAAINGKMLAGPNTHLPDMEIDPTTGRGTGNDYAWTMSLETNDPRLDGPFLSNHDYLVFEGEDPFSGSLRNGIGTLSNEGGSWSVEFHGFSKPGQSNITSDYYVTYLTGEGGYEGLSAMLLSVPAGSYWAVDGVIAPGPMPEPPTTVEPAMAE